MQILTPLQPKGAQIEAFARSFKLGGLDLAMWFVALRQSRAGQMQLRHLDIEARQDTGVLIALNLGLRLGILAGRRCRTGHGQLSEPPGFRLQGRNGRRLRLFTRRIALKSVRDM